MTVAIHRTSFAIGAITLSGVSLGLSSALAALVIAGCAVIAAQKIFSKAAIHKVSFWILLFILSCLVSGILFGGFASLGESSAIGWIGNEGRIFLYYWPALFILEAFTPAVGPIKRGMRVLTLAVVLNVVAENVVHFSTFGTHHAAGAFSAMVLLYHFFQYGSTRNRWDMIYACLSVAALLGSNSRTSLLAVVIAIIFVNATSGQIKKIFMVVAVIFLSLAVMPKLFPYQFSRLTDAANAATWNSLSSNFQLAFSADNPIEVQKAWELNDDIDLTGNANLAIRGYLFGRTFGEFSRSPFFGIGFGRINDIGREFVGVPYIYYPVAHADFPSPTDQTAHNSFLQIFTELGLLGSLPLVMIYALIWKRLRSATRSQSPWPKIGQSCQICLLFMGLTQHSFGAPIYGMSLFLLLVISYRIVSLGIEDA